MLKQFKEIYILVYFLVSLLFMEALFRALTAKSVFSEGLLISFIFATSIAMTFYFLYSLFRGKGRYLISIILLIVAGLVFSSQLIYFNFFRTFYTLYSAGNATQVFEFWKDIWTILLQQFFWIILFFLPASLFIIFGKKILSFTKISLFAKGMIVSLIILVHLIGIASVHINGKDQHSPYDLYYKSSFPIMAAEKLGLFTMMRLDLQRLLTGWSPVLEASNPYLPTTKPVEVDGNDGDDTDGDSGENPDSEPDPKEPEAEVVEYNTINIDFDQLIANEDDAVMEDMHEYFKNVPPTAKNEYTGKYEGYNLVFITAEGFSPFAVHEDVTPTLHKLVHEGYYFTNFYTPLWEVSTTDGEYVATQGLIPKSGVWSFEESANNYLPFVMGNQLKKLGYKTNAYHNHSYAYYRRDISHPNMGYEYKGIGNGLNVKQIWPASDLEMMEVSIPEYINEEPFHAYYMTVSGHMQYSFDGNNMARKNQEHVQDLPYSEQAKAYIATQVELDKALEHLLDKLEEAGVADKTLIALSTDHYPYGLEDETINELAGHEVEHNFELYKNPFILYTKNMEPLTIDKPSSSLDIIPTLSNLLGLEYDSRLLMGTDIFSDADPLVVFHNKSFITDKGKYNSITKEFTAFPGQVVDDNYLDWMNAIVNSKFYYSTKILETDYYRKILEE
ncbi:arylsulfatase A-like enzyme [Salirhabdus euzebyi]|uniref:Arylsulfatase A-like enzyme n=1 Tax=Salirhabdus euzebyi TaxID=394506 RepID=A0A841Q866_9BACI|nr:alkaline phosphatase family protein [Salirhabdus euzebyi]MBB6454482.1 arylsulfatase A-like enzyme [Salirhabdus euzebyi]